MSNKIYLVNSDLYLNNINNQPITVIDGGARGKLFSPFHKVSPELIKVIRFEPDPDATIVEEDNQIILNKGIWKEETVVKLHLNKNPHTSSVYPPDKRLLAQFENHVGLAPREVVKEIDIEVDSIDNFVNNNNIPAPDFIKLDVHSAEFESLEGAQKSLYTNTVGILVEAWAFPIHKGQKTHAQVAAFLNENNFYLFDQKRNSLWKRKGSNQKIKSKPQIIAFDSLFFKDIIGLSIDIFTKEKALKYIAIAELFDQSSYALQLNTFFKESHIFSDELANEISEFIHKNNRPKFQHKVLHLIRRIEKYWESHFDPQPF